MTYSFPAYSKGRRYHENQRLKARWRNDGHLVFEVTERLVEEVCVLPSEMEHILDRGEYEGDWGQRPGMDSTWGRVLAKREPDGDITISSEHRDVQYWAKGKRLSRPRRSLIVHSLTLSEDEWRKMVNACIRNRDKIVAEMGGMIEPVVGKSCFSTESDVGPTD